MLSYILRRALYMIPVLLGVNLITLVLFFVVAEDPVLQYAGRMPSQETLQALRAQFELDAPLIYDKDYLSGEDMLAAKRVDRVRAAAIQVQSWIETGDVVDDSEGRVKALIAAMLERESFRETEAEIINDALAGIDTPEPVSVSFADIALRPSEERRLRNRSFWDGHFFRVIRFDFADSMSHPGENIWSLLARKAPISLRVTIPMFLIGLAIELTLSLFAASHRGRWLDTAVTIFAVFTMSVPFLSYIVAGQWVAAETQWFPVSGYEGGIAGIRFLIFPIAIGVFAGIGGGVRFYRAVLVEETDRDYVRTARAKGVSRRDILYIHVLRNAGIPIVTRLTVIIPFLITGSLLIERNFEIPGLGDLMLSAINRNDFWVVMPLTYLLAVVYATAVLLTDVLYAFIDPRVRVHE